MNAIDKFSQMLVHNYAKYCNRERKYYLEMSYIPSFELYEFVSLLMSSNKDMASEAFGFDNAAFEKLILPATTKYLTNITDKDEQIEFMSSIRRGLLDYFEKAIEANLEDALTIYNMEHAA